MQLKLFAVPTELSLITVAYLCCYQSLNTSRSNRVMFHEYRVLFAAHISIFLIVLSQHKPRKTFLMWTTYCLRKWMFDFVAAHWLHCNQHLWFLISCKKILNHSKKFVLAENWDFKNLKLHIVKFESCKKVLRHISSRICVGLSFINASRIIVVILIRYKSKKLRTKRLLRNWNAIFWPYASLIDPKIDPYRF